MKKLIMWAKQMGKMCRYRSTGFGIAKRILAVLSVAALLGGCSVPEIVSSIPEMVKGEEPAEAEGEESSFVDIQKLRQENSDIFAWINVPDTDINYPVLQSFDGDDSYYRNHNVLQEADPKGAIYIEAANLNDMCDFNTVLHGSSPDDGTMFSVLANFLDRKFFEEHPYIYIYMDGNVLIYYTFAAFTREDTRLLAQYDFSFASGCQRFLDEIYEGKSMNKVIRSGWENMVKPENFIITLTTRNNSSGKQTVVVGCLVGDVAGKIDRYVDYSDEYGE